VQWDASPNAGFTTGTPWIAVNPDFTEVNAQAAWADPDSVLHHYRRLIELRHTDPTVVHGDFTMLLPDSPQVYAFTRASGQGELLVVVNVSSDPAAVEVDAAWAGTELVIGTHPGGEPFQLRPWEARVHRRRA
jgi:oligo-1,6-glucosidase